MILDVEAWELRVGDGVVYAKRVKSIEYTGDDDESKSILVTFEDGTQVHYSTEHSVTIATNGVPIG